MNSNTETTAGNMPVYKYTRAQALEDGEQIDVTAMAREAGFVYPVFLTKHVWEQCVRVPEAVADRQDERGRLWDILWLAALGIRRAGRGSTRAEFFVNVRNEPYRSRTVRLLAVCGPLDIDKARPCITICLPDEE